MNSKRQARANDWAIQKDAQEYLGTDYNSPERIHSFNFQYRLLKAVNPLSVLEVGIGSGRVASQLADDGVEVSTVDVDPNLHPDYLCSVTALLPTIASCDAVSCCQVLEHIPWPDFNDCVAGLWERTKCRLLIALPDVSNYLSLSFHTRNRRLGIGQRLWTLSERDKSNAIYCDEHCWEIGAGVTLRDVIKGIEYVTNSKVSHKRLFGNPYHRFFTIDRI